MGDTIAQTRFKNVSKHSNYPLLARGNTLRSGEDSLKLNELMELCTNLQTRVLDLEKTKTTQAEEIVSLKRRVKKLEQKKRSRTHGLKRLYKVGLTARVESSRDEESLGEDASKQGRINAIDADEDITLVNDQDDADMFDVNTLTGDEVLAEQEVAAKDVNLTVDEVTLAQALAALKSVKPKVKANVVEEPSVPVSAANTKVSAATTTTTAIIPTPRKGIVITELDLIRHDEEITSKLQAEFDEEERRAREKDEANVALTKEWDDIQAKMLKNFDKEDLEVLWSIVKARFKKTEPVNYMDNFLLLNLKTMFEHHVEDNVWKNQQGLVKVLNWKLYDSCEVHCVTMKSMLFYLLVEKMYPLTNHTLHQMFNYVKIQVDYECEMAFELLRLIKK
ncbi:hypothetical protein Tco_1392199 [Tanacetum coccineum]